MTLVVAAILMIRRDWPCCWTLPFAAWKNSAPFAGGFDFEILRRSSCLPVAWLVLITGLHAWLNGRLDCGPERFSSAGAAQGSPFAYIPVTCQLTLPGDRLHLEILRKRRALSAPPVSGIAGDQGSLDLQQGTGSVIVAPLAIALASQGCTHQGRLSRASYGSALVVKEERAGPIPLPICAGEPLQFPVASPTRG